MLKTIEIYFLLFFTYAVVGWCMEVTCKFIQYKRFINRGFLIGPYCPIYGWGAIAITILLQKYTNDAFTLFIMSVIVCSILEYFTSYFMEKKYHARWWDYSNKRFNINGRICLETMIPFGLLGVFIMYVSNPFLIRIYTSIPNIWLDIICGVLFITYLIDNIVSRNVISSIHIEEEKVADNTEEISTEIAEKLKRTLEQRSWMHKRLIRAFPNMKLEKLEIIKQRLQKKREKLDKKLQKEKEKIENKKTNKK